MTKTVCFHHLGNLIKLIYQSNPIMSEDVIKIPLQLNNLNQSEDYIIYVKTQMRDCENKLSNHLLI